MLQKFDQTDIPSTFQDRRRSDEGSRDGRERRQFRDGNRSDRPEVAELADAVDPYMKSSTETKKRLFISVMKV